MSETDGKELPKFFEGASTSARKYGYAGIILFLFGTLLLGVYFAFFQSGDPLVTIGLPVLWLIVVALRVGPAAPERELSAFVEVMKWQIAIGAAAAAIIAPIGLDPEGELSPGFFAPVTLFLVSSGCAAAGYALVREGALQVQAATAERESAEQARVLGEQVAAAVDSRAVTQLQEEVEFLRGEVSRLDQPWWKRWR